MTVIVIVIVLGVVIVLVIVMVIVLIVEMVVEKGHKPYMAVLITRLITSLRRPVLWSEKGYKYQLG